MQQLFKFKENASWDNYIMRGGRFNAEDLESWVEDGKKHAYFNSVMCTVWLGECPEGITSIVLPEFELRPEDAEEAIYKSLLNLQKVIIDIGGSPYIWVDDMYLQDFILNPIWRQNIRDCWALNTVAEWRKVTLIDAELEDGYVCIDQVTGEVLQTMYLFVPVLITPIYLFLVPADSFGLSNRLINFRDCLDKINGKTSITVSLTSVPQCAEGIFNENFYGNKSEFIDLILYLVNSMSNVLYISYSLSFSQIRERSKEDEWWLSQQAPKVVDKATREEFKVINTFYANADCYVVLFNSLTGTGSVCRVAQLCNDFLYETSDKRLQLFGLN